MQHHGVDVLKLGTDLTSPACLNLSRKHPGNSKGPFALFVDVYLLHAFPVEQISTDRWFLAVRAPWSIAWVSPVPRITNILLTSNVFLIELLRHKRWKAPPQSSPESDFYDRHGLLHDWKRTNATDANNCVWRQLDKVIWPKRLCMQRNQLISNRHSFNNYD